MAQNDPLDHQIYFNYFGVQMKLELRGFELIRFISLIETLDLIVNISFLESIQGLK